MLYWLQCRCLSASSANAQAGMRGVVNTVGRLVRRGVLPNLRRLSLGGASLEVREESEA